MDRAAVRYDRQGDQHYDVTSAFIKSIRGSDADAALHYLARMVEAGEDPRFIARRLVILASEDIGLADPTALTTAVAAAQAVQLIGMPEARLNLAQAVIALSLAPKSNAVITAIDAASADVRAGKIGPVPAHLRDAHYGGSTKLGHGKGYRYSHDAPYGIAEQQYAPDVVLDAEYYQPTSLGAESGLKERWERIRAADPRQVGSAPMGTPVLIGARHGRPAAARRPARSCCCAAGPSRGRALAVAAHETEELRRRLDALTRAARTGGRDRPCQGRGGRGLRHHRRRGEPPRRACPDRVVLSATVGEPLVKAVSFGHGLRRALSAGVAQPDLVRDATRGAPRPQAAPAGDEARRGAGCRPRSEHRRSRPAEPASAA